MASLLYVQDSVKEPLLNQGLSMGLVKVRMGGDTPIAILTVNCSSCCVQDHLPGPVLFLVILFPLSMDMIT